MRLPDVTPCASREMTSMHGTLDNLEDSTLAEMGRVRSATCLMTILAPTVTGAGYAKTTKRSSKYSTAAAK